MEVLKWFMCAVLGGAWFSAGAMAYLAWLQPAYKFPKPTGQYAVGRKTYHWIDTQRKETLFDDPAHPNRELMVTVWYPAQGALAARLTVPFLVDYLKEHAKKEAVSRGLYRRIYTYAGSDLPLVSAADVPQFPVIIFSHGFGDVCDNNTAQCEELASHGYIVVGIGHAYDSAVVQYPDGRIADGEKSLAARFDFAHKSFAGQIEHFDQEIELWVADARFVLDQLYALNEDENSFVYHRMNLDQVGMFGHSFGGATAIQTCRRDARIKVGVDMDGSLCGADFAAAVGKPCMFLLSGDLLEFRERSMTQAEREFFFMKSQHEEDVDKERVLPAMRRITQAYGHDMYIFVLKGAGHNDFCDESLLFKGASPYPRSHFVGVDKHRGLGAIDCHRAVVVVNAHLVAFFDKYLKGRSSELLDGDTKQYPEVETRC